ncbi:MAG: hypothetical protein IH886_05355 [Nitrospinae bacterium]|nr:hypothetical protein [Nitrospinota bacterium]
MTNQKIKNEIDIETMGDDELLRYALKGNVDAIYFMELINYIFHTWDDLIDKDRALSDKEINGVFWNALVDLPRSPFYVLNFVPLNAIITTAILDWQTANQFENEGDDLALEIAFIIRSTYSNILIYSALLVGGREWALHINPIARRLWHKETFAGYKVNLEKEKAVRENRTDTVLDQNEA